MKNHPSRGKTLWYKPSSFNNIQWWRFNFLFWFMLLKLSGFDSMLYLPCHQGVEYTDCIPCRKIRQFFPQHQKRGLLGMILNCIRSGGGMKYPFIGRWIYRNCPKCLVNSSTGSNLKSKHLSGNLKGSLWN